MLFICYSPQADDAGGGVGGAEGNYGSSVNYSGSSGSSEISFNNQAYTHPNTYSNSAPRSKS